MWCVHICTLYVVSSTLFSCVHALYVSTCKSHLYHSSKVWNMCLQGDGKAQCVSHWTFDSWNQNFILLLIHTLLIQGRSNRYGLYGQSRTGFLPEHKLLIKRLLIDLKNSLWRVVAAGPEILKPSIVGDAPNQPSNSVFPMRQFGQT